MKTRTQQIEELQKEWTQPRWEGITRPYSAEDVVKLRGSVNPECTLAQLGAAKMWRLLHGESKKGYINSLGALTGGQALQQAKAGIEAVYLSGWQVAADANLAASMYPDQSLYPANSVPAVVERINNTFRRADQIQWSAGIEPGDPRYVDYFLPIVADAEAGFGGVLNAFELMKAMIEAGAAAVHFEDQLVTGIVSSLATRAANAAGIFSNTSPKHPASSSKCASRTSFSASASSLARTVYVPYLLMDWGISPRCPMMGIPALRIRFTVPMISSPPSSLRASAWLSFIIRIAEANPSSSLP